jgi:hypothetical protein
MARLQQNIEDSDMSSNITETIAEALAVYTADKGQHDRTGMMIARNQARYEKLGVSSEIIRLLHKEAKLTADERQQKYANELRYRRAVSLWSAETDDDFDRAMEAASETAAAEGRSAELLVAARAYNDGHNSIVHGRQTANDNPHLPGTLPHAEWAKGAKDGVKHLKALGEEPAQPGEAIEKRGRGRPRKMIQEHPVMAAAADGPEEDESAGLLGGFPSEMPS